MVWALGIAAVLAWLGALYQLRALLKRRRGRLVGYYWFALFFISLALTFVLPPVYAAVDAVSGVPNLSKLLANLSAMLAVLSAQNVVYCSHVSEPNASRLRVASFTAAGVAMLIVVVLFFSGGPLSETSHFWKYYGLWAIAAYRLTYLAYMAVSAAVVTALWCRYAAASEGTRLKVGFGLMAAGGVVGLGYLANDAGVVVAALGLQQLRWWGDARLTDLLISLAIILVVAGAMMPVWGRIGQAVRAHLTFLRLRRLWLDLRAACPPVALLPGQPRWKDVLDPRDATFRLHRQVVEIRDASYAVAVFSDPCARLVASTTADALRLGRQERLALEEATRVRTGLEARKLGLSVRVRRADAGPAVEADLSAGGFWPEVAHLVRVARHVADSPAMKSVLEKLAKTREQTCTETTSIESPEVQKKNV